nr:MAG TPA: hypothetical protein [Caudoviricetes sp.]
MQFCENSHEGGHRSLGRKVLEMQIPPPVAALAFPNWKTTRVSKY